MMTMMTPSERREKKRRFHLHTYEMYVAIKKESMLYDYIRDYMTEGSISALVRDLLQEFFDIPDTSQEVEK